MLLSRILQRCLVQIPVFVAQPLKTIILLQNSTIFTILIQRKAPTALTELDFWQWAAVSYEDWNLGEHVKTTISLHRHGDNSAPEEAKLATHTEVCGIPTLQALHCPNSFFPL